MISVKGQCLNERPQMRQRKEADVSELFGIVGSGDVLPPDPTQRRTAAPHGVERLVPARNKITRP